MPSAPCAAAALSSRRVQAVAERRSQEGCPSCGGNAADARFVIAKRFGFAAAHHLDGLPTGHKCTRPHGHTYTVEIQLASERLDAAGFVADYAELEAVRSYIDTELDHRDLNEVLAVPPTCECIAEHFYRWCREHLAIGHLVVAVRVSESPTTWAEYRAMACRAESAGARW